MDQFNEMLTQWDQMCSHLDTSKSRLDFAMTLRGVDRKQLAESVKSVSRQYLYRLIKGEVELDQVAGRVLVEISQGLNVSIDFLLGKTTELLLGQGFKPPKESEHA